MTTGIVLCQGDRTSCGGRIVVGSALGSAFGKPIAKEGDPVTCGKDGSIYKIIGGISIFTDGADDRRVAGSLDSYSSCPCKAKIRPSNAYPMYEKEEPKAFRNLGLAAVTPLSTSLTSKAYSESEPEQHAQVAKKQNSFADTCKPEDNPLLNGVYLWTEITDAGHAFVSVHENNSIYVYTYGRFGRRGPANFTGDGILNFFTGEDARSYYREELYKVNARVFKIDDASIAETRSLFENLWNSGAKPIPTEKMGERTKRRGRVIDVYDLTGSNCTTHTVQVIRKSGSNIFETSYTSTTTQLPIESEEDFAVPLSLQNYLMRKSSSISSMQVTEVTNEFKEQYPNIDNYTLGEENTMEKNLAAGASTLGSASGYSGGTVGGFLGGSYDLEE
ncbi:MULTISPECIES: PAAR domain-containing protein [Enterobacter]|uniref:PAAR domain-containing protein n=1 Tax=Enterobacter TaxID=547 RepID=UPI002550D768|nr:PAAR domain-containing protein [Enterobacter chengduensis]MEC5767016.1 PAAR domain-containing protein [Enterobacter chengduensis]HBM9904159.1 PAAR domain-containing protein [Enterobacter chengduensis]